MTDCGPLALLDGQLRFQLSLSDTDVCMFLVNIKGNLCFSNENAMSDFRKTWYVLHEVCLGP